jgi:hypothetical protein
MAYHDILYDEQMFNKSHNFMWQLQNVPGITFFLRNTEHYNNLSYISFKIVPWAIHTSVSDCEGVGNISGKPFQLLRCILNYVNTVCTSPTLQC